MIIVVRHLWLRVEVGENDWERLDPTSLWRFVTPISLAFGPFDALAVDPWFDRPRRPCDVDLKALVTAGWRGMLDVTVENDGRALVLRPAPKPADHAVELEPNGTVVELLGHFGEPARGPGIDRAVIWPRDAEAVEIGSAVGAVWNMFHDMSASNALELVVNRSH